MSERNRWRCHRIAFLLVIVAMHVFAVRELFWRPFVAVLTEEPQSRSISWIMLPPPASEPAAADFSVAPLPLPVPNNDIELITPPAAPALPPQSPPAQAPVTTAPSAPVNSAILGTLGRSLACNLANYETLSPEEKERCIKQLAKSQNESAPPYVATDEEKRLTQQFARELAVKQAPPLLPCFSSLGVGISVLCLMRGALNGFDFAGTPSYADLPTGDK